MKPTTRNLFGSLFVLFFSLIALSFAEPEGGDSFEIYYNSKLVLKQAMHGERKLQVLSIPSKGADDELRITYSECGRTGQGRKIAIRNESNELLKQWSFADANQNKGEMKIRVKDLINARNGSKMVTLYYYSHELPKGQALVRLSNTAGYAVR